MRRHCRTTPLLALALAAWVPAPPAHADATEVGKAGATINLGARGRVTTIEIKNTTGEVASDVTLVILDAKGALIEEIDINGAVDAADDGGNGKLEVGEDDNTVDPPAATAKSIIIGGTIAKDAEREIVVTFDKPLPRGSRLKILLSKEILGRHADMYEEAEADATSQRAEPVGLGPGAAQAATGVLNVGDAPIERLELRRRGSPASAECWPPIAIEHDEPDRFRWFVDSDRAIMLFDKPVDPGETFEFGLVLPRPMDTDGKAFTLEMVPSAGAQPCYADFDGDGKLTIFDFLAFQNAFADRAPAADCDGDGELTIFDFLCFQNAFVVGCG